MDLEHDHYGHFDDVPHVQINCTFEEWVDTLEQVLEYRYGPPIAWEHTPGTAYLWGEQLDDEMLREISQFCHELEREHADAGAYDAAKAADRIESKVLRAREEVWYPDE